MHESTCSHPIVGECVNLQFYNINCSYSLSVVNFLEEQVDICICNGDFWNNYFFQIITFSEYL